MAFTPDYGTPTAEDCKAAAMTFKVTKDEKLFKPFLHRYEKLGHHTCFVMRQRNKWLRAIEQADVKQTSYLGMYQAFASLPVDILPKHIAGNVIAYVKNEVYTTFHYAMSEDRYNEKVGKPRDIDDMANGPNEELLQDETYTPTGSTGLDEYKTLPGITERQGEVMQLIYCDGLTHQEAGKVLGLTKQAISKALKALSKKLGAIVER